MKRMRIAVVVCVVTAIVGAWAGWLHLRLARAQDARMSYSKMAPLGQYLMANRTDEIALARSAAPPSISDHVAVLVLGVHGYQTAVRGTNGFVCIVARSWMEGPNDPGFWNPTVRAPNCFNAPGARSRLPIAIMMTNLVLRGKSKAQIFDAIRAAVDQKKLPTPEPGAMCYMMSKQQYLNSGAGYAHPHLMFFVPLREAKIWGAGLPGSPILEYDEAAERLSVLVVPVARWSDGTPDPASGK